MSIITTAIVSGSGIQNPISLAFDSTGNLYCSNSGSQSISKITFSGGSPVVSLVADGLDGPTSIVCDSSGNLYFISFYINSIRKITFSGGSAVVSLVAGGLSKPPSGLAIDSSGNLYFSSYDNNNISKITFSGGSPVVTQVVGLDKPLGLAIDSSGNLYCSSSANNTISKITFSGGSPVVTEVVGLNQASGLAFDSSGNLYCSSGGNTINKITLSPSVSVQQIVSGSPILNGAGGLAFDSSGNLYCANFGNSTITKTQFPITTIINVQSSYTVTLGVSPFNLNATSNSPATITYLSSNPSIVSVNPSGLVAINAVTNTPVTITLNQGASGIYTAGYASSNFIVNLPSPTITNFSVPTKIYGDPPFNIVDPSSNSTGAFSYISSDTSVADISGNTITITGRGTSVITATQAATDNYSSGDISANFLSDICFPSGTPITTDQGIIAIEKINPKIHTISNKKIIGIPKTKITNDFLVCIEKHALGNDLPSQKTLITKDHRIFYNGKMRRSVELIGLSENIYKVKYNGETLYNVLMEKHDTMLVNNLVCETLNPVNSVAKLYNKIQKCSPEEQERLINEYNEFMIKKINFSKKQLSNFK